LAGEKPLVRCGLSSKLFDQLLLLKYETQLCVDEFQLAFM